MLTYQAASLNLKPQTSNLKPQTSYIIHHTSNIIHHTSYPFPKPYQIPIIIRNLELPFPPGI